jgi:hypothetical protein
MRPRKIGANDLRPYVRCGAINLYALPFSVPFRVCEETFQHLRVEVALAGEVTVEAAVRETGIIHDLLDRDALESESVEQFARAGDDPGARFFTFDDISHIGSPSDRIALIRGLRGTPICDEDVRLAR